MEEPGRVAVGAASAVIDGRGRILLVRHTYGPRNWELPGGLSLAGEDPASTAQRELREETGLDLGLGELVGLYFEPTHRLGAFFHVTFRILRAAPVLPTPSSDEVDAADLFAPDGLPRPMSDFTALRIEHARQGGGHYAVVGPRQWLT
ncbi:MAG TPA: NUDIX hydrolase [Candidatus Limnocylindrales bacterium]|nr:NUDIX hydrolase [Candidatus Limnocylindrales bacterium]